MTNEEENDRKATIAVHRIHVAQFHDNFNKRLNEFPTVEEQISYTDFHIVMEEQRINRYENDLKPNLYITDRVMVDEIKSLLLDLNALKSRLLNNKPDTITDIKHIQVSIIESGSNFNTEVLASFLKDQVFKPSTRQNDIEALFSYPMGEIQSDLVLAVNNKEFVYLLNSLRDSNILVKRGLFNILSNSQRLKSAQGTLIKRSNLDQASKQIRDSGFSNEQFEKDIERLIINIKRD